MLSNKVRAASSVGSLLFAGAILWTSLISASQPFAYTAVTASHASLYIGSRILPDHVLYPVAMLLDKVILLTSSQEKQFVESVALAFDRLDSAEALLQKDKPKLALMTLKKSQHYLLVANTDAQADKSCSVATKDYLRRAMRAHIKRMTQLQSGFPVEERQAVADMIVESSSLYKHLPSTTL